jgi:4-amino-4-deoxy-L-arabinose transferase-like glycosyltransferase
VTVARRPFDTVFLLILLIALVLRFHLARTEAYIHDENNTSIPLSKTISFAPGNLHLPLRGQNHGALPAYVVKASSTLFGTTPLAYRSMHVLVSLCTIALIYLLTRQWYGPRAARWAAALFAFNEYYLAVSARATAHVPHLFFVAVAIFAFSRFLAAQRAVYLYAAGVSVALAFYCKEHSALLLPVFLLTLLQARYRQWLRSPHVYLACATFVLVIGPDLFWNLNADPETARVTYGNQTVGQATYGHHLQRVGGVGFSPYPSMFYARRAVTSLHRQITGRELKDETPEYPSMNPALGLLLLGAVLITTFRPAGRDQMRGFLLLVFWGVFGFFTLIKKGDPPGRLDPVSWIWVEVTIIPAVILAGARLADATGKSRIAAWAFSGGVLLYATAWPAFAFVQEGMRGVHSVYATTFEAIDNLAINTVTRVRSHPLRALGIAVAAGVVVGSFFGFLCGWFARSRRRQGGSEGPPDPLGGCTPT